MVEMILQAHEEGVLLRSSSGPFRRKYIEKASSMEIFQGKSIVIQRIDHSYPKYLENVF